MAVAFFFFCAVGAVAFVPIFVMAQEAAAAHAENIAAAKNTPEKSGTARAGTAKARADKSVAAKPGTGKSGTGKGGTGKGGTGKGGLRAHDWAFSGGGSREQWQQGVPCDTLQSRAVGEKISGDSVDTASGIDRALKTAGNKEKRKGGMALRVDKENASWRAQQQPDYAQPDEDYPMESRHVVRAYADTELSDDLSISLGTELILKNEQRERLNTHKQPDSILGMGMQLKLDF